jgi:Ca2+-binding RTX toxin-like protein
METTSRDDDAMFFYGLFAGNDRITLSSGNDYFEALGGNDAIYGNAGSDALFGNEGNDKLYGGLGNDDLYGGLGDDVLSGGAGIDSALYDEISTPVTVNLSIKTQQDTGGGGKDTLSSIERLYGGSAGDTLTGTTGNNDILGNDGDDVIDGLAGTDRIYGGNGKDTLTGGLGRDRFVFYSEVTTASADKITDFNRFEGDRIVLSTFYFSGLSGTGGSPIAKGEFYAAAGATSAHDADDHIIYNTATGDLYYDPDGLGGTAAILFATLGTTIHPKVVYSDFLLDY